MNEKQEKTITVVPKCTHKPPIYKDVLVVLKDDKGSEYYVVGMYDALNDIWMIRVGSNVHMLTEDKVVRWAELDDV